MNFNNKAGMAIVCVTVLLFSSTSYAQQKVDKPGFYASLTSLFISDDNVYRQATTKISDSILTLSPELLFINTFGKHQFSAEYTGNFASYSKRTAEDYADHFVNADLQLDFSRKFNIDLQANYNQGHEFRDASGIVPNVLTKPNTWVENRIFAGFTYGRKTAKAQVELDIAATNMDYTNNNQDSRDRKNSRVSGRVYFNIGGKSAVFVEAIQNTVNYLNPAVRNLDSTENYYHAGVRWEASNKTTGIFKVGSFNKNFDSAAEKDGSDASYEANIIWKPKSYSHLILAFSSAPKEAATADSFYTSSFASIDWKHKFNSKLGLNVNLGSGTDEYTGTRKDKLSTASLGLDYKFRRWLDLGLGYTTGKRDSSVNTADYTDNLLMLTATFSKL